MLYGEQIIWFYRESWFWNELDSSRLCWTENYTTEEEKGKLRINPYLNILVDYCLGYVCKTTDYGKKGHFRSCDIMEIQRPESRLAGEADQGPDLECRSLWMWKMDIELERRNESSSCGYGVGFLEWAGETEWPTNGWDKSLVYQRKKGFWKWLRRGNWPSMSIGKGEAIAWSWRQLRERSVRRDEETDGDLNGWTTSEVAEIGWRTQEDWRIRVTPTALLRHAKMRWDAKRIEQVLFDNGKLD